MELWEREEDIKDETYVWKSATVAFSPVGKEMNSWPAPLMMVRGTSLLDTGRW